MVSRVWCAAWGLLCPGAWGQEGEPVAGTRGDVARGEPDFGAASGQPPGMGPSEQEQTEASPPAPRRRPAPKAKVPFKYLNPLLAAEVSAESYTPTASLLLLGVPWGGQALSWGIGLETSRVRAGKDVSPNWWGLGASVQTAPALQAVYASSLGQQTARLAAKGASAEAFLRPHFPTAFASRLGVSAGFVWELASLTLSALAPDPGSTLTATYRGAAAGLVWETNPFGNVYLRARGSYRLMKATLADTGSSGTDSGTMQELGARLEPGVRVRLGKGAGKLAAEGFAWYGLRSTSGSVGGRAISSSDTPLGASLGLGYVW